MAVREREALVVQRIRRELARRGWYCIKIPGGPYLAGFPDLLAFRDGVTLALEVKALNGKLSKLQEVTIEKLNEYGVLADCVSSLEEAVGILDWIDGTNEEEIKKWREKKSKTN